MNDVIAFVVFVVGVLFILAVLSAPTTFDPRDHPPKDSDNGAAR